MCVCVCDGAINLVLDGGGGIIIHILGEWGWYTSCPGGRYKSCPGVGWGGCVMVL